MTPPKRLFTATVVLAFLSLASTITAKADTVNFNFEQLDPTVGGALTTLTLAQGGLTMTLTRESGTGFDIFNNNNEPNFPQSWGARSLAPSNSANTAFIANFSQPLSSISIDMGDSGQDADMLLLQAYDATGTLMETASANLTGGVVSFTFVNLSLPNAQIHSIRFIGGSTEYPGSVFYDNITVTFAPQAVPEPTTMVLLGMGLAGMALKRFRSRKTERHESLSPGDLI